MTEAEIQKMDWKEFNANFVIRVEGDCANVWVVPRTDPTSLDIELRIEKSGLFAFCVLKADEAKLLIEKLQKAVEEVT